MSGIFIAISSVIALIALFIYARSILKGQAKPHRTTRIVLLIITAISTAALLAANDKVAVWLAGVSFVESAVIFTLSIKHGMGGWSKLDLLCLSIALFGIVLWKTTNNPVLALYFSLAADFIGVIPTLYKSYHHPKTEIWTFYLLGSIAALFSLCALTQWRTSDYLFPLYIFLINAVMVVLIIYPRKK